MPTPQVQNDPIYTLPFLYKNGLIISNDATTPNTVLDISAGQCRDSNDVMDIVLGSPNLEGLIVAAPLLLNFAVNGVNGLDTGTIGDNTMYAIYMIADSRYYKPTACIATLATNAIPLMPFGYDSLRLIGYWATNVEGNLFLGYMAGNNNAMKFFYDAPQATAVTAGSQTSYTPVVLGSLVPPINNMPLYVQTIYAANAANNTLHLKPGNGEGNAVTIISTVATGTANTVTQSVVFSQLISGVPNIQYQVAAGSVEIDIAGFDFYV